MQSFMIKYIGLPVLHETNRLLNFLGPRSFEKGSYHTNRFINLLYSGNFISYLLLNFIVISVGLILLTI